MPKISALTLGATIDGANDLFAFVDVSDVTQAPTGTTKKAVINSIPTQNIYNTSSSLTGSRVVTLSGNALEFREGTALLSLDAGNFGVVVGTGTATASAVFEVSSTTKGVLVPRMTTAQKNVITTPATSLLIFDTDNNQYEFNSGTPAAPVWSALGGGGGGIYGGDGNLPAGETNVTIGANTLSFDFADATTAGKIVLKDGGTEWARIRQLDTTFEHHVQFSSVGVETENRGALLQLRSTTQAVLFPRMTTTERDNIPTAVGGMLIYNNLTNEFNFHNGSVWGALGGGGNTIYSNDDTIGAGRILTVTDTVRFTGGTSFRVDGQFFTNTAGTGNYTNYLKGNGQTTYFLAESQTGANFLQLDEAGGGKFKATGSFTQYLGRAENSAYAFMFKNAAAKTNVYLWETSTGAEYINYLNTGRLGISVVPGAMLHVQASVGTDPLRIDTSGINNALLVDSDGDVGINGAAPTSAILGITSTTKGFLPPVMTGAQVEAISAPTEGLVAWATNAGASDVTGKGLWVYDGTNWVQAV